MALVRYLHYILWPGSMSSEGNVVELVFMHYGMSSGFRLLGVKVFFQIGPEGAEFCVLDNTSDHLVWGCMVKNCICNISIIYVKC